MTFDDDEEEYNPSAAAEVKHEDYSYKPQEEEDQYKTAYETQAKPQPVASSKVRFDDDEDTAYDYKP